MLVVIDIQEYYLREFEKQKQMFNRFIETLEKRIQQAKKEEEIVINLTCFLDGFTLPEVLQLLENYKHRFFLGKEEMDGSNSLHEFFQRKKLSPKKIELCGAFRDICVLETWKGLKKLNYNLVPVKKDLSIPTSTNWKKIITYPKGYLE